MENPIIYLIIISLIGPIIGSLIGVIRKPSDVFTYNLLSFAAGVMLAISFLELIPESIRLSSELMCIIGIIAGAGIMLAVNWIIPHIHPTHYAHHMHEPKMSRKLMELKDAAILLIVGIFIHNLPEGLAIGVNSTSNLMMSFSIAIALTIHDIPEAICTSAPYYKATGKRLKSFLISVSTAIPTVIGIILAYHFSRYLPLYLVGMMIGGVAGLMIYITAEALIPCTSYKVSHHHTVISLICGVLLVLVLQMMHIG